MAFKIQRNLSDFLEYAIRVGKLLPKFQHKPLLFRHLIKSMFKSKRNNKYTYLDIRNILNWKYFVSKGYLGMVYKDGPKVVFNYQGIQAYMPLKLAL